MRLIIGLTTIILFVSASSAQEIPYQTGFELIDTPPFTLGNYNFSDNPDIDGQGNWIVESGDATITSELQGGHIFEGAQSLEVQVNGQVNAPRDGETAQVVWLQGAYQTEPQPADPNVSELQEESSALMYFNNTEGIKVYNGAGDSPGWEEIGVPVDSNTWYLVAIRLDFSSQTWDIYVGNELKRSGIGFKDNTVTKFNGFRVRSSDSAAGYLDQFYVGEDPPANIRSAAQFTGEEYFLYSILWDLDEMAVSPANETAFMNLNQAGGNTIDWLDIYEFKSGRH